MNLKEVLLGRQGRGSIEAEGLALLHNGGIVLFVYLFCMCMRVHMCHSLQVEVRGQFMGMVSAF